MENATKGLMIAGAILIAIVLIGIGVFLVSQAQNWITRGGDQFSQMEKDAFNSTFVQYEGRRMGSEVKNLLTSVNSNNMTAETDGLLTEKGITVRFASGLKTVGNVSLSDIIVEDGTEEYVSTNATKARSAINTGSTYFVAMDYDNATGLIDEIAIANTQEEADGLIK